MAGIFVEYVNKFEHAFQNDCSLVEIFLVCLMTTINYLNEVFRGGWGERVRHPLPGFAVASDMFPRMLLSDEHCSLRRVLLTAETVVIEGRIVST